MRPLPRTYRSKAGIECPLEIYCKLHGGDVPRFLALRGSVGAPGIFFFLGLYLPPPSPNNLEYLWAVSKNLSHPLHPVYDNGKGGGSKC